MKSLRSADGGRLAMHVNRICFFASSTPPGARKAERLSVSSDMALSTARAAEDDEAEASTSEGSIHAAGGRMGVLQSVPIVSTTKEHLSSAVKVGRHRSLSRASSLAYPLIPSYLL